MKSAVIEVFFVCSLLDFTTGFLKGSNNFSVRPGSPCSEFTEQTSINACVKCQCKKGVTVCYQAQCPKIKLPDEELCKLVYLPGQCCPSYECPTVTSFIGVTSSNDPRCHSIDPCKRCSCENGVSRCDSFECLFSPQTKKPGCFPIPNKHSCCPEFYCPIKEKEISNEMVQNSCTGVKCLLPVSPDSCVITITLGKCCPQVDCSPPALPGEEVKEDYENSSLQPGGETCTGEGRISSSSFCEVCFCSDGMKKCTNVKCPNVNIPAGCKKVKVVGECCPRLECGNDDEVKKENGCSSLAPIQSNDPCSLCNCSNGWKICTLMSCTNQPLAPNCHYEKIEGQCCPEVHCDLLVAPTTEEPEGFIPTCNGNGKIKSDDPCQICFCKNGRRFCTKQSCLPAPDGCTAVMVPGKCCPQIRCGNSFSENSPTAQEDPKNPRRCIGSGEIPSNNPCTKCTCSETFKLCSSQFCPKPSSSLNCREITVPGQCCKKYDCSPQ